MIYTPGEAKKDITLKIKTIIIDEENPNVIAEELEKLLFRIMSDGEVSDGEVSRALGEDASDEIELCTEATVETNEHGQVVIKYMENPEDPRIATLSSIIFHPKEPGLVIMSKKGAINTVLSFEAIKTHICTYDTPYMPFKVYVTSRQIDNRLLSAGKLNMDYVLNINDTAPQHFIISVTAKPSPEDTLRGLFDTEEA